MIFSPADDFSGKTLAAIPGTLGKLQYVAGLRQESGVYVHWGMSRSHGEAAANQAIAAAHAQLFIEILRTPLSHLVGDLRSMASQHATEARQLIQALMEQRELLVPQKLNGGSLRHFNSVLRALSVLADAPALQSDPAALQFRPLGQ
jgi:hypothetical protein